MIETALIKHFVAVAETGNFRRASEQLHVAQSVVSRSIRRLEEELGAILFERTTRNVQLTAAGKAFLSEATAILHRLQAAATNARHIEQGSTTILRIALCPTMDAIAPLVGKVCQKFRQKWPKVDLQFSSVVSDRQEQSLREAGIDVGFLQLTPSNAAELQWHVIAQASIGIAIPTSWGGTKKSRRLSELSNWPWLMPHPKWTPEGYDRVISLCRASGFEPQISALVEDSFTCRVMLASGLGAAFTYEQSPTGGKGYHVVKLESVPEAYTLKTALAWSTASTSEQVKAFVDCVAEVTGSQQTKSIDAEPRIGGKSAKDKSPRGRAQSAAVSLV